MLIATSFMQSLLLSVKRLRRVLIIFLNLQSVVFWEAGLGGKEQVEEMCPIFVQEKGLC